MKTRLILAGLILLGAGACGGHSLDGKYADANGMLSIEFKSGSAYVTTMGGTTQVKYEVDGDQVKLSNEGGNMVLTRGPDGSLEGAPTGKLVKQ